MYELHYMREMLPRKLTLDVYDLRHWPCGSMQDVFLSVFCAPFRFAFLLFSGPSKAGHRTNTSQSEHEPLLDRHQSRERQMFGGEDVLI
jgi:hypothetical protein